MNWQDVQGHVFDIERYATQDGPGIRTAVFFKGCPLQCKWCANPESLRSKSEVMYYRDHCSGCQKCVALCPVGAIEISEEYGLKTDAEKCTGCGICVRNCFFDARRLSGKLISAGEVIQIVLKDKMFYGASGGGITITGGEPFLQPDFLEAILRLSVENKIHTALETSGYPCKGCNIEEILGLLDLIMVDIKHVDPIKFRQQTGADNAVVLENIRKISAVHPNIIYRIPCIPGFNHSEKEMHDILTFIRTLDGGRKRVEILPYHRLGRDKYKSLGREYAMGDIVQLERDALSPYIEDGKAMGFEISAGPKISSG